jgi:hypothetical protein
MVGTLTALTAFARAGASAGMTLVLSLGRGLEVTVVLIERWAMIVET